MSEPWLQDPDVTLWHGDALEVLRQLPDRSVHMVATSPPFYGLRDYAVEGQIGLEETPDEWVDRLVAVFRECRRVLRDDGSLWIEIGDSYNAHPGGGGDRGGRALNVLQGTGEQPQYQAGHGLGRTKTCKPKDLLGQPWLLAFALRADGWYLRSEIIWARPNPMPESVTDRPTKSHSTVFLLSKSPRYFYDADAIREGFNAEAHLKAARAIARDDYVDPSNGSGAKPRDAFTQHRDYNPAGANARSVWTIPTEPTSFAHFATWPQALVRRMIQAGTSEKGCCPECGTPWVRDVESTKYEPEIVEAGVRNVDDSRGDKVRKLSGPEFNKQIRRTTLGWCPTCECYSYEMDNQTAETKGSVPCTVLDPFAGSGTTCLVARNQGRHAIGIELNQQYLKIAGERLQQLSLLA